MAKVIKYCLVIGAILWLRDIIINAVCFCQISITASITRLETWSLGAHIRKMFFSSFKLKEFGLQSEEMAFEIWILLTLLFLFLQITWRYDTLA